MKHKLLILALFTVLLAAISAQEVDVYLQLDHGGEVNTVVYSPDGKRIATASKDKTIKLWEADTGKLIRTLSGHDAINSIAFSPDGKRIISGSFPLFGADSGSLTIWDTEIGSEVKTITIEKPYPHGNRGKVAFSPDGKKIFYATKIIDAITFNSILSISDHRGITSALLSKDGKQIIGIGSKSLVIWDATSGKELRVFTGEDFPTNIHSISNDGKYITCVRFYGDLKIRDTITGKVIQTFSRHTNTVFASAFSPDGKSVISASADKSIKIWDVNSGRELRTLTGHTDIVSSVAFSPDGKRILSGSYDGTAKIWDASDVK